MKIANVIAAFCYKLQAISQTYDCHSHLAATVLNYNKGYDGDGEEVKLHDELTKKKYFSRSP